MAGRAGDGGQKRDEILRAAEAVFVGEGYASASMDRIAERAGASKRTVYNYFPSKEHLFHAVLGQVMADSAALEEVSYDPRSPLDVQLAQFANAKLVFAENRAWVGMMRVISGMLITDPELVQAVVVRSLDKQDFLVTWLQAATQDGRMDVPDPRLAAEVFWAMVSGAFFWPAVFGAPTNPVQVEGLRAELVRVFLARYAPGSGFSRAGSVTSG